MSKVVSLIEKYLVRNGGKLNEEAMKKSGYLMHKSAGVNPEYDKSGKYVDYVSIYFDDGDVDSYEIHHELFKGTGWPMHEINSVESSNKKITSGSKIKFDSIFIEENGRYIKNRDVYIAARLGGKTVWIACVVQKDPNYPYTIISGDRNELKNA